MKASDIAGARSTLPDRGSTAVSRFQKNILHITPALESGPASEMARAYADHGPAGSSGIPLGVLTQRP